ncbi:hexose transporter [Trypanosoma grayi]|uniref:hexose transporter n=1 Tax=Trypanosoma grayi TaxID=71804 RepID=UPI0004F47040|nr:hexose transporter [Trypanosoma grayi]KEG09368.1 hexose transporter [Trypanosoma grayi]
MMERNTPLGDTADETLNQTTDRHSPAEVKKERPAEPAEKKNEKGAEEDDPGFFSLANLIVAQVCIAGGLINGYTIGLVPIYAFLYLCSTDCSLYKSENACSTVLNVDCLWDAGTGTCMWREFTCSVEYPTDPSNIEASRSACQDDGRCNWVYSDDVCKNPIGYTSVENGIFACAMVLGAMFGAMYSGKLVIITGHNATFTIGGIIGVVSSIMYHVSVECDEFWVLCVGRLLMGLIIGAIYVVCPMYLDQNAIRKYYHMLGASLGAFTTFGIMFAAIMGLALGRSIDYTKDANIGGRMQGLCAISTAISMCILLMGIFLPRSKVQFHEDERKDAVILDENEYSWRQMTGTLVMGVVMAGSAQLTGINAVMNYAPTIMGRLGMEPLLGNFVVMAWNFLTSLTTVLLARWFTMRQLFLFGSFVSSAACLLLCGVPVYPGVAKPNVRNGVAITGIAIFIFAFEIGLAACFGVLTQDVFPASFRPKGASFVMLVQFFFNIIINLFFPIAVENISGGPSGNQDKGQAVAFIFFGCVGFFCSVLELFFLFPWEDKHPREGGSGPAEPSNALSIPESHGGGDDDEDERNRAGV